MKEVVNYRKGEFVDYNGETHHFIVAAVSTTDLTDGSLWLTLYGDRSVHSVDAEEMTKGLFIGVSVCNPKDEFDEEKGKMIAYNKATNVKSLHHPAMFTTRPGFINTEVVEALLNNIVNYIKKDPGSVIAGYDEAKKKFLKKAKDQQFVDNSSKELRKLAEDIKALNNEDKKNLDRLISIV